MAIAAATAWEVRTTGSDTNGGGYSTGGTDWSQQDAAQYSVTDGVTAGTTTITSATAAFGTDVVGNVMYVAGGTGSVVAGWYQITARTNSTTITVDRSTGLTAGTGVTLKVGGALASPGVACAASAADNTIWLKTGTYSTTSAVQIKDGSSDRTRLVGYGSARGDTGTATVRRTSGSTALISYASGGAKIAVRNVVADCNGLAAQGVSLGNDLNIDNVDVLNATQYGFVGGTRCYFARCRSKGATSASGFYCGSANLLVGCWAEGASGDGFTVDGGVSTLIRCVSRANTRYGFMSNGGTACLIGCTAHGNTSHGARYQGATLSGALIANCIFSANGGYGVSAAIAAPAQVALGNAYWGNTSGQRDNALAGLGDVTLSGDPYTSASTGDFSLNSVSGAGAACRGAGYPGVFPGGTTTGYSDIGAAQHQDTGGGGGGVTNVAYWG